MILPLVLFLMCFQLEAVQFTMRPSDPSYVINGSTAKLVWDYSDPQKQLRGIVFSVLTKSGSNTEPRYFDMLVKQNGVVQLSQDIPSAYQERVSIEGNATLVIDKITPKDSTQFKCTLVASVFHKSTIQLIVAGMYCKLIYILWYYYSYVML